LDSEFRLYEDALTNISEDVLNELQYQMFIIIIIIIIVVVFIIIIIIIIIITTIIIILMDLNELYLTNLFLFCSFCMWQM
jgi:hypothetical protein